MRAMQRAVRRSAQSEVDEARQEAAQRHDVASGGMRLGRVVAVDESRCVLVEFDGCAGPTLAKLAMAADTRRIEEAVRRREVAVLGFEDGDMRRPIVMGFVALPLPAAPAEDTTSASQIIQVDVDGRRLKIEAQDEIVFQCGKASVTLRRNGKVVIRGTHIETNSEGTNRIKGGQVRIN